MPHWLAPSILDSVAVVSREEEQPLYLASLEQAHVIVVRDAFGRDNLSKVVGDEEESGGRS
jgi:hypothetical protein